MAKSATSFQKGHGGTKPKGAVNKATQQAKELFVSIMEGEVDYIKDALAKVRAKDPLNYLNVLSKYYPYFMPKQLDITNNGGDFLPPIIEKAK